MAYARFSRESDVYVYEDAAGLVYLRCQIVPAFETRTKTRSAMIRHLEEHLKAGQRVPSKAIDELKAEIEKEGDVVL